MKKTIPMLAVVLLAMQVCPAWADGHDDDPGRLIAAGRSAVSLTEVIGRVAADSGGQVVEVRLDSLDKVFSFKEGPYVYKVEAVTGAGVFEYVVEPASGKIISSRKDRFARLHEDGLRGAPELKMSLDAAVEKAEQTLGGQALSAELEEEDGLFFYRIRLAHQEGGAGVVLVDPLNGKVHLMPLSSRDEHGD